MRTAIFGHSKFIPIFLGKIVGKRFRTAIFGHSKFIPVSLGKLLEKIQNSRFWPIQICSSLFRKNCWKNLEWPFLAILNLYQSFWEKLLEKNQNSHFWPFQIYTSLFGKNCQQKFGRAIFDHSKFIAVFLGTLLEKIEDSHFWPFQICTSLFGKNCWKKLRTAIFGHSKFIPVCLGKIVGKKFGMAIFGHSKFIPVCLGKIVQKNLEQPFLAIPNLYQSLWEKLLEKIWNSHFWPFQIYSSHFGKNCWKKLRTAIFGHSKFVAVFLGKIVGKNLEQPFLAIPNLYQSLWEKLLEKNQNSHFWPFQIYTSLGKIVGKRFRKISFVPVSLGKIVGKISAIFGHSKFIPVFLGKIVGKNLEEPFLAIPNLYQSVWEKLLEKTSSEWPFLAIPNLYQSFGKNCWKKFGTAIFGHSKFIPVSLGKIVGKIVGKDSEQPFLAIPNLYQSFWEKLLEKIENSHFWPFQICTSLFRKNCWKNLEWPFLAI